MHIGNKKNLKENKEFIILDCRFDISEPKVGLHEYEKEHIEGAFYIDLEKDLTGKVEKYGGRHPLPDMDKFIRSIEKTGINKNSNVLIYDGGDLVIASRLGFMLNYIGIENTYIYEGGFELLKNELKLNNIKPKYNLNNKIDKNFNDDLIVNMEEVKKFISDKKAIIIDSRANERYLGLEEPLDKIAGRIPSSVNYYYTDNLVETRLKDINTLENMYKELKNFETIIVHCGSGVSGCVNTLVLDRLNIKSKLYLGSYSDWISYDNNEIIIKDNKKMKVMEIL